MHGTGKGRPWQPNDPVIVTGSGTGIGLATALHLAGRGFRVFATVRNIDQRDEILHAAADRGVQLEVLRLDLTDRASIDQAVSAAVEATGGVYALVNNGGVGLRGCTEDCSEEEIKRVFDTNVLGTIAVIQAVLPHMRAARRGRIVTVSSVGGRVCGWGVTMYCATKFAQEALGEGLAQELAPFGIQSVLIEPGMIETSRWSRHRGTAARASDPASPYHDLFWASEAIADKFVARSRTRPEDVAHAIHEALTAPEPKMRYIVGRGASLVIRLRRHMPPSLFERLYFGGHIRRLERQTKPDTPTPPLEAVR